MSGKFWLPTKTKTCCLLYRKPISVNSDVASLIKSRHVDMYRLQWGKPPKTPFHIWSSNPCLSSKLLIQKYKRKWGSVFNSDDWEVGAEENIVVFVHSHTYASNYRFSKKKKVLTWHLEVHFFIETFHKPDASQKRRRHWKCSKSQELVLLLYKWSLRH